MNNQDSRSDDSGSPVPPLPFADTDSGIGGPTVPEAGRTFDDGKGRVFPCESCGADLEFHIGQQSLTCPFCQHVKQIELSSDAALAEQDFHAMLESLKQRRETAKDRRGSEGDQNAATDAIRELRCESCGGNVEFVGTLTSSHCPYCNSPIQLEDAHKSAEHRIPVDGVLGFQIDRNQAKANLKEWVSARWFAPNDFRKQGAEGKFNGVYLSYYTFDSLTSSHYRGQRGEYYYVTVGTGKEKRTERRTRWYPATGGFQRFFDDVLVLANSGLRRDFMLALEPWPLEKVVPFNQQMLAGFLARTYDIELDDGFNEAKERIDAEIHKDVLQRIGGDTQQVDYIKSRYDALTFKHLLLPVWLMAYGYRQKTYQIFINAATGEVQGERPYSVWKILFAVLVGLATGGGIFALTQK